MLPRGFKRSLGTKASLETARDTEDGADDENRVTIAKRLRLSSEKLNSETVMIDLMSESIVKMPFDRVFNTMFHGEKRVADAIGKKHPLYPADKRPPLLAAITDPDGICRSVRKDLASSLLVGSGLKKLADLCYPRNARMKRERMRRDRGVVLRMDGDFEWRIQGEYKQDPWLLLRLRSLKGAALKAFIKDYLGNKCFYCLHKYMGRRIRRR